MNDPAGANRHQAGADHTRVAAESTASSASVRANSDPERFAPGLVVLHGNRLEWLKEAVIDWTARQTLGVLEEDVFLVQSNGIAEWLKMALAERLGVCAATRVELPARFLWRTYRGLLGRDGAPATAPLDKGPMVWRLMRVLGEPALQDPVYAPLHRFLDTDLLGLAEDYASTSGAHEAADRAARRMSRRLQLAQRLADLFDQYQVYRADWLTDWASGRDVLSAGFGRPAPEVPDEQRWQPALWRLLLDDLQALDGRGADTLRPAVHARFVETLTGASAAARTTAGSGATGAASARVGAAPAGSPPVLTAAQLRRLPRRVIAFGMSNLPWQTLEALAALSHHCQVVLAVPNPCRYHWADIMEGRELLRQERRRFGLRDGRDLAALSLPQAHALAHPLLAAWGRQGRDFIRLLDAFDDAEAVRERLPLVRIDLFDGDGDAESEGQGQGEGEGDSRVFRDANTAGAPGGSNEPLDASIDAPGTDAQTLDVASSQSPTDGSHSRLPLLRQVQAAVRDLLPLSEHPLPRGAEPVPADGSIVFHLAHSAVREVEILHDQLLQRLGRPSGADDHRLTPRDIVVMVPDIEPWAPLIHAVFGQYGLGDARRIPYEITDLRPRGRAPVMVALEWLLRIDQQRCTASELRDLLDVPAVAQRFGLGEDDRVLAARWLAGAGVRWGLNAEHRASLGLGAVGEQNTWAFGLRRMMAGYACGPVEPASSGASRGSRSEVDDAPWHDIDPFDEVGGLDAAVAGSLDALVGCLLAWWRVAREPATPAVWDTRARALLAQMFKSSVESDRVLLAELLAALGRWRESCKQAGFEEQAVPLAVLREAWLDGVVEPGLRSRFLAGGVVFCTLMPMRAIPFRVVCLLGMNEGDYPRRAPRSDFDLLGLPGQRRPGDRARRDDDRMLMLEAVLAARDTLYLSWAGRSVRDNTAQPPSVLVAQLRDYLAAGWGARCVAEASLEHPLQPFSRRYFEPTGNDAGQPGPLFTYAREWRDAHVGLGSDKPLSASPDSALASSSSPAASSGPQARRPLDDEGAGRLTIKRLGEFLRQPVAAYFRDQLGVQLRPLDAISGDDEPLGLTGLDEYGLLAQLLADLPRASDVEEAAPGGSAEAVAQQSGQHLLRGDPAAGEMFGEDAHASAGASVVAGSGSGTGEGEGEGEGADSLAWRERLRIVLQARTAAMARRGELPVGAIGERWQARFLATSEPMCAAWQAAGERWPQTAKPLPVRVETTLADGSVLVLDDWLDGLRTEGAPGATLVASGLPALAAVEPATAASRPEAAPRDLMALAIDARRLCRPVKRSEQNKDSKKDTGLQPDPAKLLMPWLRLLVASAARVDASASAGNPVGSNASAVDNGNGNDSGRGGGGVGRSNGAVSGCLIGRDAVLHLTAPAPAAARDVLEGLLKAWHLGHQQPLRVAQKTAIAWVQARDAQLKKGKPEAIALSVAREEAVTAFEGGFEKAGENEDPVLARLFDDADALLGNLPGAEAFVVDARADEPQSAEGSAAASAVRLSPPRDAATDPPANTDQPPAPLPSPAVGSPTLGDFAHWAELLYAPLVHWCATRVQVEPLPSVDGADEAGDQVDEEGDGAES